MRKLVLRSVAITALLALTLAAATDPFASYQPGLNSPGGHAAAVVPNDAVDLTTVSRGIYVGTGGDLKVTTVGGETVTFVNAPGGGIMPLRVTRIWATGTTASDIVDIW